MFITQRYIPGRELLSEFIGQIFENSGEIRVRDSCSRKRVEYRVSISNDQFHVKYVKIYRCEQLATSNDARSSPTYHLMFSFLSFDSHYVF